jgi:cysteine desulfurase
VAADLAHREAGTRRERCSAYRARLLAGLAPLEPRVNGDPARSLAHVVNLSVPGLDSEAVMVALRGLVAVSNGSACTSQSYQPSHVLQAMGLPDTAIRGALRLSWCHFTEEVDWLEVAARIARLR